ncbi:GPN-loop GTPase 2 [Macrosteles quadrilineatus]|uniref:GPN-loop GTPase 2 n=1 Tax=Macrosteles quadrilineatus TaxID=74068 RepID=UPI0023E13AFF|nr:GPN-loop GTPase 2 [Macrosteles quadrilineatus]
MMKEQVVPYGLTVSTSKFGQLVIGPPGSGKSTYCDHMAKLLVEIGRKVAIVNLDPANDLPSYSATVDVQELITVEDTMAHVHLGPNGGLVYCMEYLEKNLDWLTNKLSQLSGHYFIFDCPGQVELYTHHNSMKNIMMKLKEMNFRLCTVHLVDSHYCSDPGKFISTLLLSMTAMLQMELPHVNVLSKIDQVNKHGDKLRFGLDFYTEVLDLEYLLDSLQQDPFTAKYKKLNAAMVSLVEDYSLVSFLPLSVHDKQLLLRLRGAVDRAGGYIYGAGEERSVQALLACAVGAEPESDRTGTVRDQYSINDPENDLMMVDDPDPT